MKSIARRLALISTGLVGVTLLGAAAGVYFTVRSTLVAQFDRSLQTNADALVSLLRWEEDGVEFELHDDTMPRYQGGEGAEYFTIAADGHGEIARSRSLGAGRIEPPAAVAGGNGPSATWDLALPDGRSGRGLCTTFTLTRSETAAAASVTDEGDPGAGGNDRPTADDDVVMIPAGDTVTMTLVVAASRQPVDRSLAVIVAGLLAGGGILALLIPLAVAASVRIGLRPLRRLDEQVERIDEHNLDARVDGRSAPAELRASIDRINDLLARLAEAFAREKRFAAGAAHEMRTPLAEMRTIAEVALRHETSDAAMRRALGDVVGATSDLETLLHGLLLVARGETRNGNLGRGVTDAAAVMQECAGRYQDDAAARGLTFRVSCASVPPVRGERAMLIAILDNLVSNAARYAPEGSTVDLSVAATADGVRIQVSNAAPDLDPADLERLFEPLWRRDVSRTATGTGLGLSVARTLARQIGTDIKAALSPTTHLLTMEVSFVVSGREPTPMWMNGGSSGR